MVPITILCSFREGIYLIKTDSITNIVFHKQLPRSSEETQQLKYGMQVTIHVSWTWLKFQSLSEVFVFVNRSLDIINV